jgi:hypothetical protein
MSQIYDFLLAKDLISLIWRGLGDLLVLSGVNVMAETSQH